MALLFIFTLLGCGKYLDEMPQNQLKPATVDDYSQLLNKAYITKQVMPYLDILSDDVALIASDHVMNGPDYGDVLVSAYMWEDAHESTMTNGDIAFEAFYESIFYCNLVIENIDDALGTVNDETLVRITKTNIKGEALVLRAYSYFHLVNLYAKAYDPNTADEDPGIPLNLDANAAAKDYTRNSVAEVYEQIKDDLLEGIKLLEENELNKTIFQFDAFKAKAFLSRVYLYMHDYDKAIECGEYVLSKNSNIYNLQKAGETLNESNNTGTIWVNEGALNATYTNYLSKDHPNVLFVNGIHELLPSLAFWPFATTFSVNRELAGLYEINDVRRFAFFYTYQRDTYSGFREKFSYAKTKHTLSDYYSPGAAAGQTRVLRVEEILLILAESYARKGDISTAIKYLNQLREPKFRTGTYIPLGASNFNSSTIIDFIMLERRRELCFEGHRWFDLRRTTRPAMSRVGYDGQVATLKENDPKYVLQIPQKELLVNPKIEVNPR